MEADVKRFRHKSPELFWNIIFYMSNYGLPYDMFLPYQDFKELNNIEKNFDKQNEHCIVHFNENSNVARVAGVMESRRIASSRMRT